MGDELVVKEYVSRFGLHGKHWIRWGGPPLPETAGGMAGSMLSQQERGRAGMPALQEGGVEVVAVVRYVDDGINCHHLWVLWREEEKEGIATDKRG